MVLVPDFGYARSYFFRSISYCSVPFSDVFLIIKLVESSNIFLN